MHKCVGCCIIIGPLHLYTMSISGCCTEQHNHANDEVSPNSVNRPQRDDLVTHPAKA